MVLVIWNGFCFAYVEIQVIVRNSQKNEKLEQEERQGNFPFNKKSSFDLSFVCDQQMFKCFMDGEQLLTFTHRIAPHKVNKLTIEGDVELQGVHFK